MRFKHILFASILLSAAVSTSAQVGELRNNWAVGISAGASMSDVTLSSNKYLLFPENVKQSYHISPNFGVTIRYISEKYFAMICGTQLELNFSQRGWTEKLKLTEGHAEHAYTRRMNYLEIPFLVHLAFGKDRGAQFFVNAGPQVAFLLSESESKKGNKQNIQYGKMADNKFDYGIVGGLGMELRTGIGNFLLEGRYYFGLNDFYKVTKKDDFSRAAHSTISAKLTYLFDLKK